MKNVLRTLVYNGQVSLTLADTTEIVWEGVRLHKLSRTSAATFGRALSAMTFMSACLKEETGEISLSAKGNGSGGEIAVSGNRDLCIRGYIDNTEALGDGGEEAQKECWGEIGSLTIIRNDGYSRPFVGACAFPANGTVDEAFEEYFRISEQLPTRFQSVVETDEEGNCTFAGVAVLQPLPFADEETLQKTWAYPLEDALKRMKTSSVSDVATALFETSEKVWELRESKYKCNCSRHYLARVMVALGETQMREIIAAEGAVRVHCHYCNTDYEFTAKDADALFKRK
ncbi:MAG: Hsp33 family molecular chaperone HslO [Clostridia bacterium]|nr:Hsp33 family molecular chaperone HslO [Clostridia bacterium]